MRLQGKVWKDGESEGKDWMLEHVDRRPNIPRQGRPGIHVHNAVARFDDFSVERNR